MDDDILKKQRYLQTEILDKGIEPNQFQEFCERVKGEGITLVYARERS